MFNFLISRPSSAASNSSLLHETLRDFTVRLGAKRKRRVGMGVNCRRFGERVRIVGGGPIPGIASIPGILKTFLLHIGVFVLHLNKN